MNINLTLNSVLTTIFQALEFYWMKKLSSLTCLSYLTGMLPKEEYEYTTFRCAFCNVLNQARKKRPVAPRLSLEAPSETATKRNDSSDSESSDDDSGMHII